MSVSSGELVKIIRDNNSKHLAKILVEFGFVADTAVQLDAKMSRLMDAVLMHCSSTAHAKHLSDDTALTAIRHLSGSCNIFTVASLVCEAIDQTNGIIDNRILSMLTEESDPQEVKMAINSYSINELWSLLRILANSKIDSIDSSLTFTIVERMYEYRVIPTALLFAYLADSKNPIWAPYYVLSSIRKNGAMEAILDYLESDEPSQNA